MLLPVLKELGIKAGSLKHTEHDGFNWDLKGKDTFRHFEAGSMITGIFGNNSFAFNFNDENLKPVKVNDLIHLFYNEMDLVLIEGLKKDPSLKIEVCRPDFSSNAVVPENELLATYGANLFGYKTPHFNYGRENNLGKYIADNMNLLREISSP